jgi:hypothetical protein
MFLSRERLLLGGPTQDLNSFHTDVNKLLNDIDKPVKDDDLSDVDEDELLVSERPQCTFERVSYNNDDRPSWTR